jgi:glutaredoxin
MHLILYTKDGCPWCRDVLAFLRKKNVAFEKREVLGNRSYFDELVQKSGQTKTPTLDLDGAILADAGVAEVEPWLCEKRVL